MANLESPGAHSARHPGVLAALDPHAALVQAEATVSETLFSTQALSLPEGLGTAEQASTAADAVRDAAALAREGKRAGVLLMPRELLGAVDAIAAAAASRAPILIHVSASRDSRDASMGRAELAPALDLGAGVIVSWSAQDAVDLTLIARRAAEDSETPFIHVLDAEASGPSSVLLPSREICAQFLGPRAAPAAAANASAVAAKRAERGFATRVPFAIGSALRELGEQTGRVLGSIERHHTQDAEEILVAIGSAFAPARAVAQALNAQGRKVGVVGVRCLRPFFGPDVVKAIHRGKVIVVVEPLDIALAPCGRVAVDIKAAFADALTWAPGFPGVGRIPPVVSVVFATLDGSIREEDVTSALAEIGAGDRARRVIVFGSEAS